jgi:broad specificity phosphatase PhoE
MRLYFVRHGESEANLLNECSNRGLKHGLTETGKQQARALAQSLRSVPVAALFSSPLLRARQTAEILAHALGIAYQVTDALREFDCGILEGKSDAASWHAYWQLSEAWLSRQEWEQRIEQGESFVEIQQRFVPFVDQVLQVYGTSASAVVLVGHGGTYRCMLPLVLRNIDFRLSSEQGMGHTVVIVAELRPEGLVCVAWEDTVLGVPLCARLPNQGLEPTR